MTCSLLYSVQVPSSKNCSHCNLQSPVWEGTRHGFTCEALLTRISVLECRTVSTFSAFVASVLYWGENIWRIVARDKAQNFTSKFSRLIFVYFLEELVIKRFCEMIK